MLLPDLAWSVNHPLTLTVQRIWPSRFLNALNKLLFCLVSVSYERLRGWSRSIQRWTSFVELRKKRRQETPSPADRLRGSKPVAIWVIWNAPAPTEHGSVTTYPSLGRAWHVIPFASSAAFCCMQVCAKPSVICRDSGAFDPEPLLMYCCASYYSRCDEDADDCRDDYGGDDPNDPNISSALFMRETSTFGSLGFEYLRSFRSVLIVGTLGSDGAFRWQCCVWLAGHQLGLDCS